jgi:hypothetical protein
MDWLKSRSADWQNYSDLSRQEKWLLAVSMLLVPIVVLAHRLLGLNRVQWTLNRFLPYRASAPYSEHESTRLACSISRIVRIAANRCLCQSTCLQQSVLLQRLLAQRGIDTDLRIGVSKRDGIFEAHAWVEFRGHALNESADVKVRFVTFPRRGIATLPRAT